ncbi:ciliary microtubule associated protein 1A-like [Lineus longissimus]|uniref:ciliary microtubule associated protein 1A-like n=1 Tax=Lineus longissimus TaxID=88925 RepID=UPI00315DD8E3
MVASDRTGIPIAAKERGPGPGRYKLPTTVGFHNHDFTKHMKPEYSFGRRLAGDSMVSKGSPGPSYFIDSRMTRHGKDGTPIYSILGRQKDLQTFMTPSPGSYCPEKVHPQGERHAPVYSMSTRTKFRHKDQIPAPSSYSLPTLIGARQPNKRTFPSYSMTGRSKTGSFSEDLAKTPGPGQYNATEPNIVKQKSPIFSMLGRSYMPGDNTNKPGPGAHRPELVVINKHQPPKFSLGIRHSEFVCPIIVSSPRCDG